MYTCMDVYGGRGWGPGDISLTKIKHSTCTVINLIVSHVTFSIGVHSTRVLPTMSCIVVHVIHICSSYTCIGTCMSLHDVRAIQ